MTLNAYLRNMSEASGISVDVMLGDSRKREVCVARQIIWSYLWNSEKWSTIRIGRAFNRNHATVLYGIKCAYQYRDRKPSYQMETKMWEEFENLINNQNHDEDNNCIGGTDSDNSDLSVHNC